MKIIGHRGAKGLAPENTLASLRAALKHKVDGIEFDVRVSKDGVPVLNHNSDISVPGNDLDIAKTDYADLKTAKPNLMPLDEALDFLRGKTAVVIEVKRVRSPASVVDCLQRQLRSGWRSADISVSSFSLPTLQAIRRELPDITVIVNESWSGVRAGYRARKLGTEFITMNRRWLWGGFIRAIVSSGRKLSVYTVNDPAKAKKWQKYGLHAVITDYPDRFQSS